MEFFIERRLREDNPSYSQVRRTVRPVLERSTPTFLRTLYTPPLPTLHLFGMPIHDFATYHITTRDTDQLRQHEILRDEDDLISFPLSPIKRHTTIVSFDRGSLIVISLVTSTHASRVLHKFPT